MIRRRSAIVYFFAVVLIITFIHTLKNFQHPSGISNAGKSGSEPKVEWALDSQKAASNKNAEAAEAQKEDTKPQDKAKEQPLKEKNTKPKEKNPEPKNKSPVNKNKSESPSKDEGSDSKSSDKVEKKKDSEKSSKPRIPLFKHYSADTVDLKRMTLRERVESRHRRHLAYLKEYETLSDDEKEQEKVKLQDLYYMLEWRELDSFKNPVSFSPNDYDSEKQIQPAGKKVLVLSANDGKGNAQIGGVLEATNENREEYCNYHGYINYFVNLTKYHRKGVHPVWSKVSAIREAFDEYPDVEWIWWLDTDAIITNPQYAVAEHILHPKAMEQRLSYGRPIRNNLGNWTDGIFQEPGEIDFDNVDMIITQDFYGINAGSFFIKRSTFTSLLLAIWDGQLHIDQNWERLEQDALIKLFLNHEVFQQHIALAPQRLFNSYTDKPEGVWSWQPGDFVIHLAGCNEQGNCERSFHRYWNARIQVPKEHWVPKRIRLENFKKNIEQF